jgi:release factor glutamine methyltransferase
MSETWTILKILNWTKDFFAEKGLENPRLNAELILAHVLADTRFNLYVRFEEEVSQEHRDSIRALVKRRAVGEPLQYVLGETEFYGLPMRVTPAVLIPRPETEYLVEMILQQQAHASSILDIGTGSGCIAITLKKHLPHTEITAVDISQDALSVARENGARNDVEITWMQSDLLNSVSGRFDCIVSNPPYIPQAAYDALDDQIRQYEPQLALLADEDGLICYRRILQGAKEHLHPGGKCYFEIGHNQGDPIRRLASEAGFEHCEVLPDLNGFDRYACLW